MEDMSYLCSPGNLVGSKKKASEFGVKNIVLMPFLTMTNLKNSL